MRLDLRTGFTLIEAILALTLGAVVLLNVRLLIDEVGAVEGRIRRNVVARDQQMNGMRIARRLFANAHVEVESTKVFVGGPDRAALQSWCDLPAGIWARCRVTLSATVTGSATLLHLTDTIRGSVLVAAIPGNASLAYLVRDSFGARWEESWVDRDGLPLALSFASLRDSITFAIGGR